MPLIGSDVSTGDGVSLAVSQVLLEIPDNIWVRRAIISALTTLTIPENWLERGSNSPDTSAGVFSLILQTLLFDYEPETMVYPRYWLTHAVNFVGGFQGSYSYQYTSPYHGINAGEILPIAQGNQILIPFFCEAGQYDIWLVGEKGTNFGITDLSIDGGAVFGSMDWYNAVAQNNQEYSDRVVIAGDGMHWLSVSVGDKRAASTNYRALLNSFRGLRTGDP